MAGSNSYVGQNIFFYNKSCNTKDISYTIAKTRKQSECPFADEWLRMWNIHAMKRYSATKKNEIPPLVTTWMNPESIK